jgi:hypothetical protein
VERDVGFWVAGAASVASDVLAIVLMVGATFAAFFATEAGRQQADATALPGPE